MHLLQTEHFKSDFDLPLSQNGCSRAPKLEVGLLEKASETITAAGIAINDCIENSSWGYHVHIIILYAP